VMSQGTRTQSAVLRPQEFISPASHQDVLMEGLQGTVQALATGLSDTDVRARRGAMDVLEALGPAAAVAAPALVKALGDSDPFIRWAAARTMGKISPVAAVTAVPGLAGLLADLDLDVRLAAATALERYGPAAKGALPELTRAMRASDAELRTAAIGAVGAVGANEGRSAIPALIEALSDTDPRVRQMAAKTLGKFGTAARGAVESLNLALEDSDTDVQKAASEALLNIRWPVKK
jgi:HEAT repeat protein